MPHSFNALERPRASARAARHHPRSDAQTPTSSTTNAAAADRRRLGTTVLAACTALGWDARDGVTFAEALTDHPWEQLDRADLLSVLAELHALMDAIADKAGRSRVRLLRAPNGAAAAQQGEPWTRERNDAPQS